MAIKLSLIDDCAETDDDGLWEVHLEFHKSDLEIVDEMDEEVSK